MGLAASQARFLGLTARKSNVEFQAQQINQARTALSNKVHGLYSEYNSLEPPVAPSVNDFIETTYQVDSTYEKYEIQNFSKITQGKNEGYYNVTLSYEDSIPMVYSNTAKNARIIAQEGANGFSNLTFNLGTDVYTYDENDLGNSTITKITEDYDKHAGLLTIMEQEGKTDGVYYMYQKNGVNYYTSEADLQATAFSTQEDGSKLYAGDYTFSYQGDKKETKTINSVAALEQDASGRISSIAFVECEDDIDLVGKSYSINVSQSNNQAKYQDAMVKHNWEMQKYEHEIEKINKETEKIQAEDRSLEMKLNQLETEQKAISTEMDSIKNVIKDTTEKIFKTFDG